jgi:hypothetical protein
MKGFKTSFVHAVVTYIMPLRSEVSGRRMPLQSVDCTVVGFG